MRSGRYAWGPARRSLEPGAAIKEKGKEVIEQLYLNYLALSVAVYIQLNTDMSLPILRCGLSIGQARPGIQADLCDQQ